VTIDVVVGTVLLWSRFFEVVVELGEFASELAVRLSVFHGRVFSRLEVS